KHVPVCGAGRTDAGVHALAQTASFHSKREHSMDEWRQIFNYHLPATVRVLEVQQVAADFHAQRDARAKVYEYRVLNRRFSSALNRRAYFFPARVDWDLVRAAIPLLVGRKDFACF